MKPNLQTNNLMDGTAVDGVKMTIDARSTAHIIGLLTDLYSDPIMAVIREYSTNAWDSHVEAGVTGPIHITTPNHSNPFFRVQDYGVGMSKDDIFEIYSMYGASTKRETNAVTGMLGLGCKSGLTYAVQFTVDAVKDGMRTVAVIGKGEDGVGEIQILSHASTPSPNGVAITVPVNTADIVRFNIKIDEFFFYWREGVLVDGEVPESIATSGKWRQIDPDVYVAPTEGYTYGDKSRIVQGNVAYGFSNGNKFPNPIVAYVPIGLVDFTPSREDLHLTDRTEDVIHETVQFAGRNLMAAFGSELEQCDTDWDRLKLYKKWQRVVPNTGRFSIVWSDYSRFTELNEHGWKVRVHRKGYKHKNHPDKDWTLERSAISSFPTQLAARDSKEDSKEEAYFVLGFEPKSFSDAHYERLLSYGFPDDMDTFYVIPSSYGKKVATKSFPGVWWSDVPKLPRKPRAKSTGAGPLPKAKYTVYRGDQGTELDVIPASHADSTLYYVTDNRPRTVENSDSLFNRVRTNGHLWDPAIAIALITPRQEDKFCRLNPRVKRLEAWFEDEKARLRGQITPEIEEILTRTHANLQFRSTWRPHAESITNPHFLSLLNTGGGAPNNLLAKLKFFGLVPSLTWDESSKRDREHTAMMSQNYPLIQSLRHLDRFDGVLAADAIEYINNKVPDWFEEDVDSDQPDETNN